MGIAASKEEDVGQTKSGHWESSNNSFGAHQIGIVYSLWMIPRLRWISMSLMVASRQFTFLGWLEIVINKSISTQYSWQRQFLNVFAVIIRLGGFLNMLLLNELPRTLLYACPQHIVLDTCERAKRIFMYSLTLIQTTVCSEPSLVLTEQKLCASLFNFSNPL